MSGEQKLKDELEKAVWHRDCTSRIAKNLAKNVDSLKSENAALKEALSELIPIAERHIYMHGNDYSVVDRKSSQLYDPFRFRILIHDVNKCEKRKRQNRVKPNQPLP